jgi:hypothetical protein
MLELNPLKLSLRLLLTWLALSLVGFLYGADIISTLLPFISWAVSLAEPAFSPLASVVTHQGKEIIQLAVTTTKPLEISKSLQIPIGTNISTAGTLVHALVPLVILWTPVIAWPTNSWRERIFLLILALPATVATAALTTSFFLAGRLYIMFSQMVIQRGDQWEEPPVVSWLLFSEGGGRWLLPIVLAVFCILAAKWVAETKNC